MTAMSASSRDRKHRSLRPLTPAAAVTTAALLLGTALAGCGQGASGTGGKDGALDVVVGFYPLAYATQQIGGDHVQVTNLTKSGAEPHDVELTPADVATVSKSQLAVYEKGLQPAVDDAVADQPPPHVLDVTGSADLTLKVGSTIGGESSEAQGDAHGTTDPHFWLDPVRYAEVAKAIAGQLKSIDPDHASTYEANLARFTSTLHTLDTQLAAGLKTCANRTMVTSHSAFGYLANRYGLTQVGIAGISPDEEPDAAKLAALADYTRTHHVTTIYTETLASPAVAQTIASETGAKTAVLDPIEGLSKSSAAQDYVGIMKANLATLRQGQGCS
ncbi:zinc ABC transporter substrate-binding protein [Arsenicicoccus piscis]|uniref:Zinc ABC transporter substrate-binding protein n=2 Tax=Arsenicicoccus piscis TaxID=673954 RepID=A0ABQ6HU32_9MICO|nr:zinc ABC transporter substrate-binding protein [Arsenicicoccus piscis]GMA21936.1 zinc ABC transporter substrate-binding protein [Arsenicicoccus piscis]